MVAPIAAIAGKAATQYFAGKGVSAGLSRMGGMAVQSGVTNVMSKKNDKKGPGLGM